MLCLLGVLVFILVLVLVLVLRDRVLLDDDDNERLCTNLAKTTPSNRPAWEHLLQPCIHLLPSRSCLWIHLDAVAVGLGLVPDAVVEVVERRHLDVCWFTLLSFS